MLVLLTACVTTNPYEASGTLPGDTGTATDQQPVATDAVEPAPATVTPSLHAEQLYHLGMQAKAAGDYQAMLDHLIAAADLEYAQSSYELARMLTEGKIVVRDIDTARFYLERSAAQGNPEALRVMAWNIMRGEYGPADIDRGKSMMHQAAEQSARAQRELGMLYANVYQPHLNDAAQAELLLTQSAETGDSEAAYQLARLKHASGDSIEAVNWFDKAAAQGHPKAKVALKSLSEGESLPVNKAHVALQATVPEASGQPAAAPLDADVLYRKANALLLRAKRTLEQEAQAYAMLVLASEQGHKAAQGELFFQSGVKTLMDRQNPNWLEEEKSKVAALFSGS